MHSKEYALKVNEWSNSEQWYAESAMLLRKCGFQAPHSVLDVGTNMGRMLRLVHMKGGRAVGVEKNEAARYLAEKDGHQVYHSINEAASKHGPFFNIVLLNHVLGHVKDPVDMILQCVSVTKRSGAIGIVLPNPKYDVLMAPMNVVTRYKGDDTLKHSIGLMQLKQMLPHWFNEVEVFYMGEKPRWLPGRVLPESYRSRLGVVIRRSRSED